MNFDVYTLGFSNRSWQDTVAILRSFAIERVIDIRTLPGSRYAPQFNQQDLAASLRDVQIDYVHLKQLGGFRKAKGDDPTNAGWKNTSFRGYADYMQTVDFERGLQELIRLLREKPSLYACTEAVFWRCHRALVSDALLIRGFAVGHIFSATKCQPHHLTGFAHVEDLRITYPAP